MAKQTINLGTSPNDGTGDKLRTAFTKVNANFDELYASGGTQGATGNTGAQGASGTAGTQGTTGNAGPQGSSGTAGTQGASGGTGTQGPQGTSGGGGANTGNVVFTGNTITYVSEVQSGDEFIPLKLGFTDALTANGKYLYIRAGDNPEHIHLDTGNNSGYDQFWGDDSKYLKLSKDGAVEVRSYNSNTATGYTWTFANSGILTSQTGIIETNAVTGLIQRSGYDISLVVDYGNANREWTFLANGTLGFPDNSTGLSSNNIVINNSGFKLDGGSGVYWSGQSGVAQVGDNKGGVYHVTSTSNNALFTFGANGAGYMSVGVEGSMFIGTANPSNDGGVTTAYPGWLVVQNGGKFGAGIDTLGSALIGGGVHERYQTKSDANGVVEHAGSSGHVFYHTSPDANWTANFTSVSFNPNYATTLTLVISQGANAYYANNIQIDGVAQTINWQANTLPIPSNNRIDVQTFSILYNGSTYIVLGQMTGF